MKKKLNATDMIDELQANIETGDQVKAQVILSYIDQTDTSTQKRLLFDLARADAHFNIPLLYYIFTSKPEVAKEYPFIEETLLSNLLTYPDLIVSMLEDPYLKEKSLLVKTAGELHLEAATSALLQLLGSTSDTNLASQIIEVIGLLENPSNIDNIVDYLYSGKRKLIRATIRALGAIATPAAIRILKKRLGTDEELDMEILAIFAAVKDEISLRVLTNSVASHSARIRTYAKKALIEAGSRAIPIVAENLKIDDPDAQIHSLNVLGDIADSAAVSPIRQLLAGEPDNPNVRFAAYEALSILPLQKGAYALAAGLSDPVEHVSLAAAKAIDKNMNEMLCVGIRNMINAEGSDSTTIVRSLILAMADNVVLELAKDELFVKFALQELETAHTDLRRHYHQLFKNNNLESLAEQISLAVEVEKRRLRACAVDDSRMILSIYKNTLHKIGCEAIVFEFPETAIEWLKSNPVDILLTDLNMPEITGIELTEEVRKTYTPKQLPIIMVTTQNEQQDNTAAYKAGIDKIIQKPFNAETLKAAMAEFIDI